MEETRGFTIKDLLIRLILIIVFIILLIWLFPMPDLKPLNSQIFLDNVDRMKEVAKTYYTTERLPKNINDYKQMTLKQMIDEHLILPLIDSKGNTCSAEDSYVKITKTENEYVIKVQLSCTDRQDYVIEHFGCYDICSDTCKALETTTVRNTEGRKAYKTTLKKTTTIPTKVTTAKGKLYEYEFSKNICEEKFDSFTCPNGYTLVGEKCVKKGTSLTRVDAKKNVSYVTSTDTKDAKAIIDKSTKPVDAVCKDVTKSDTINATKNTKTVDANKVVTTKKVTADKVTTRDVKAAIKVTTTENANYIKIQNYSVITATKYISSYKWVYDYTKISTNSGLAYVNANDKLVYITSFSEAVCEDCPSSFATVTKYKYYHYNKEVGSYSYSCDKFPGYTLYDTNKCRKATNVTTKCPSGYSPNGSVCSKSTSTLSCAKYGSDYVLDKNAKTCTKTTHSYKCNGKKVDTNYCTIKETSYSCPSGTTKTDDKTKCTKTTYSCPSNTSDKTYTLTGTKCAVKIKTKSCTCPSGTAKTDDQTKCIKTTNKTTYSCKDYPGYSLTGKKCVKTTKHEKIIYSCDKGILDGATCVITDTKTDVKNAEKKYRTECKLHYKWSTKTSIDGWIYTGNKRQIN